MTEILVKRELEILESGTWGTIGPRSRTAAEKLAEFVGSEYGLLCHSADAAYEVLLRQFNTIHGTRVVTGEVCTPANALIALCVGAMPAFAPVCERCGMIQPDKLDELLSDTQNVTCVVLDLLPEALDAYPLDKVYAITRAHGVGLIIHAGGFFTAKYKGEPLCRFCDAVLYSCEAGSEIDCRKGSFIATDHEPVYAGAYAYHNCGRSFGEGCSLNIDGIIGGDMRVTEFTSVIAEQILESGKLCCPEPRRLETMAGQPVFSSDYAKKMTGIDA